MTVFLVKSNNIGSACLLSTYPDPVGSVLLESINRVLLSQFVDEGTEVAHPASHRSMFMLLPTFAACLCGQIQAWGLLGGDPTQAFSRGASPPRPICGSGSQQPDVWCPRSRLQLWSWRLRTSLADPVRLGGVLSVTGFSPRSRVGWGSICAGVCACRNLLGLSFRAGEIPQTHVLQPPQHPCLWVSPGVWLPGAKQEVPAGWLYDRGGGGVTHPLWASVTRRVRWGQTTRIIRLPPPVCTEGLGHWPRTASPLLSLPQTPPA